MAEISRRLVADYGDQVTVFTADGLSAEAFSRRDLPRLPEGSSSEDGVEVRRFRSFRVAGPVLARMQRVAYRFNLPFNEQLRNWFQGPILPGLARAIRDHPSDIVVASSFPLLHMYVARKAAHQSGKPCVLVGALHPDDTWGFDRDCIHRAIKQADRYIAYTDWERQHVISRGAPAERVLRIGLGVDVDDFAAGDVTRVRAELGIGKDTPLLGFIGQLAPHKGIDTLLSALPQVWEEHPQAHCLLAGAATAFQADIERNLAKFSAEERSRIHLRVDFAEKDKPDFFAALDVLAYPSRFESFGLAYLEAWAAAKPVVGCRIPAIEEIIEDGRTGRLIPAGDSSSLASVLNDLLGSTDLRRELGEAGRRQVSESGGWAATVTRFRESYVDLIQS